MERRVETHESGFWKGFWVLCIGLWGGLLSAQTVEREALSSGGAGVAATLGTDGARCTMTWTIGEPIGETYAGSKKILSQGFQQGEGFIRDTIGMDTAWAQLGVEAALSVALSCYPNPTAGLLEIRLDPIGDFPVSAVVELTDLQGRCLYRRSVSGLPWREGADLSAYPAGTYVLTLQVSAAGQGGTSPSVAAWRRKAYKIIKY